MSKTKYLFNTVILVLFCIAPSKLQFVMEGDLKPKEGSVTHLTTPYEYALMSDLAYSPHSDELRKKLRDLNWRVLALTDVSGNEDMFGYFAVALRNKESDEVVIAHRGTNPNLSLSFLAGDFLDDIGMFFGNEPKQYKNSVEPFLKNVCDGLVRAMLMNNEEDCESSVVQTGHSLGAALAELSAYYHHSRAITFDSPGTGVWINSGTSQATIIGYVGSPNIINTVNPHVGKLIMVDWNWFDLEQTYRHMDTVVPDILRHLENKARYIRYTIEAAHPLENIMKFLGSGASDNWRDVSKCWITGLDAGYQNFLNSDSRTFDCEVQPTPSS